MRFRINFVEIICSSCFVLVQCQSNDNIPTLIYPDGGYEYPKILKDIDTNNYLYPVRDLISTKDSLISTMYSRYWAQAFDEPNLSIKPQVNEIFRLTYQSFKDGEYVITLTRSEIIVKQSQEHVPYPEYDSTKLSPLERSHYEILSAFFPIQNKQYSIPLRKRLDSLAKRYPKLLDFNYYRILREKSDTFSRKAFKYVTRRVEISAKSYFEIVDRINKSGFWESPYKIECPEDYADGYSFTIEANTHRKYNIVARSTCASDTSSIRKACQELINASKAKISVLN